MSGIMDKLHRHKTPATTTTAPIVTSQAAGGPILTSSTGLAQQGPALYTPSTLKTSGGILNTGSTNILNTTTPLTTSTTVQQPIQHATTHVSAPIIQETVRNDRVVEVQPVLHREVDQNIVHHIEKHYTEAAPSQGGIVERQPIVQQAVHTNVVNEIQPIIHRERVVPVVERSEQHLSQHIVQPTIHTHEVIYERGSFMQQGQTLVGSGGIQQQGLQGQTLVGSGGFQQGLQGQNLVGSGGLQQQQFLNQGSWAHQNYGQSYQGLSFPYTNAAAHPNYGYQRLPRDRKAERFELKAAEWERRGNLRKAQKNRDKALRLRQKSQPGYVAPARPQSYYTDRVGMFDQKALQYQQWGMQPQSQRYQQRASRMRSKYNLPASNLYTTQQQGGLLQPSSLYTQQQNYYQQQPWQGGLLQQGLQGQNLGLQQGLQGQNFGLQQGQNFGLQQGQNLGFQQGLQGQSLGLQQQGLQGQNLGLQQGLQGQNLQQGGALQQGLQGGLQGMQQGTGFTQGFQQGATRGLQQQGLQQQGLQQQGLQQQGLQQGLQQNQPGSAWTLQGLPQEKILQQQQLNQPNQFTSAR